MTDTENVGLARLNESIPEKETKRPPEYYPFALVLRLRVLQIVFGIIFLIIGTVAFIEEKGEFNLGLAIPTGVTVILAAAASIHTTRGFSGYRPSTSTLLRFLGPTLNIALTLTVLWLLACTLLAVLLYRTISTFGHAIEVSKYAGCDLLVLTIVECSLAVLTLSIVFVHLRVDCKYDPD